MYSIQDMVEWGQVVAMTHELPGVVYCAWMSHVMYCYTGCILDRAFHIEETMSNFLLNYGSL